MRSILAVLFLCLPGGATTYYVATTGSNSNAGTSAVPFLTIQHAADVVNPGDTVLVENGTYSTHACSGAGCILVAPTRSGTSGNYITFQSQNPGGAVLDGLDNTSAEAFEVSASYLIIKGFEIKGFDAQGISTYRGGSNIDIIQNNIHDIGRECTNRSDGLNTIFIGGNNTTVEQNKLHDSGRYAHGVNGCNLSDAAAHDHGVYVGGYSGTQTGVVVKNNITWNLTAGWAVQFYGGAVSNSQVVNNTFAGPPNPVQQGQIVLAEDLTNITIENNIFYQPNTAAIKIYSGSTFSGVVVKSNLTYQGVTSNTSQTGLTASGNLDNTNPMLVNAGADNLALTSGSPAIDAGLTVTGVTNDYAGTSRPQGAGYDIGAYEYSSGTVAGPTISTFTANPSTIAPGGTSTLSWVTAGATSLSIDQGVGTVTGLTSKVVTPSATTTYTLTATNATSSVVAKSTITVTGTSAPVITSFTASPTAINSGATSTLSWSTTGATSLMIDQGMGSVTGQTSMMVKPQVTTTYALTASNGTASVTQKATVTVNVATGLPVIKSFTANPTTIVSGQSGTLSWATSGAKTLSINEGIGLVTYQTSETITPNITATYTLTATNANGSVTSSLTVPVKGGLPVIKFFTANPTTIVSGQSGTLSWATSGAKTLSINQGIGLVTYQTSETITPNITATYTLTATNANGSVTSSLTVPVKSAKAPTISTTSLPNGQQHENYTTRLTMLGGSAPYTWSISSGNLPAGLSLSPSTGIISGRPSATEYSSFTVQVTDANSQSNTAAVSIMITSPGCH